MRSIHWNGRKPDRTNSSRQRHDRARGQSSNIAIAGFDSGVRFLDVDMPEANDLTVCVMALVAQQERVAISHRTKEAVQAANASGVKLGNPNGAAALRRQGRAVRRVGRWSRSMRMSSPDR